MSQNGNTSGQELRQIARLVLASAQASKIPETIARSLESPTFESLEAAAHALLAGHCLDGAAQVFSFLEKQPKSEIRAAAALARIVALRGDAVGAEAAWRRCLNRFADRAEPYWFGELARAERQLERNQAAEQTLRQGVERFPRFGATAVQLADLLIAMGRPQEAVPLCEKAIRDAADPTQPWWYKTWISALTASGGSAQLEEVLREMSLRFSDSAATLVAQAEQAVRCEDWSRALTFWTACIDLHADSVEPYWLNAQAVAYFRLLRIEEALQAWKQLIARFPDFLYGYSDLAAAAEEIGDLALEKEMTSKLISLFPDQLRPDWLARLACCLQGPRPDPAIHLAIAELEAKFPDSSLGRHVAIDYAHRMQFGMETLAPIVTEGLRRFPNDPRLMAEYITVLLASGDSDEAERIIQQLEAEENNHFALISRWRFAMDHDGVDSIKESAIGCSKSDWPLETGLAIADFLMSVWAGWSTPLALAVYENLDKRFCGRLAVVCGKARALVVLRQDDAALELIGSVPSACQTQAIRELRAWAFAKRGDDGAAKECWQIILASHYFPAVHAAEPNLELLTPESASQLTEGVAVFLAVRNEMVNLRPFLTHYRTLGVRRFIIVDNGSTDGSEQFLRAQADVILYRTEDDCSAANFGMRWINALIARHAANEWCLFADADEAFIYPGWETTPLHDLIEYLDEEGAEGVAAFMLDVYPQRLVDAHGIPASHADAQYFDGDYEWVGHVRPPYLRPIGGVRSRLFRVHEYLQKVPLIRSGCGIYIGNHETSALKLSEVRGTLLHYKLTSLANNRSRIAWPEGVSHEVMRRYEVYASRLNELSQRDLRSSDVTQKLTDSFTLAKLGILNAPDGYKEWCRRVESASRG